MQQTAQPPPEQVDSTGSLSLDTLELLSPIGYRNSSCGYCHSESRSQSKQRKVFTMSQLSYVVVIAFLAFPLMIRFRPTTRATCRSYYASAESLSAEFYEDLLCRGWRRSGTLLYRPDQRSSCCPHYTIRLDSYAFKASKDQRQALNRFNRYILGENYIKESARINPRSKQDSARRKSEFDLSERVHESELPSLERPPQPNHEFVVTIEPNDFTEEKYALFENYQRIVHHEPPHRITQSGFHSFLCSSPLRRQKQKRSGIDRALGSYHQCYRLDGKLVAVGVLDLLPHAVSAVYFMYHESIHTWTPGKISAMRETALAAELGCKWYMMGFYIHNCRKMKYKVDFHPQYVLDPESYAWDLMDDDLKRRLDGRPYVSLSREKRESIEVLKRESFPANSEEVNEMMDPEGAETADNENNSENSFTSFEEVSLFDRNMPGIMPRSDLHPSLLNHVKIRVRGQLAETSDLISWETSSIDELNSIKRVIAELVAAVGAACAEKMCVVF